MMPKRRIFFLSAHSLNSLPMLMGLMNELSNAFTLYAIHIRVKEYAQLPAAVIERSFSSLKNRQALLKRSRFFNFLRYLYLNYHMLGQVLAGNRIIYCTDDTVMLMVLTYYRFFRKKKNTVIVYHEFENADEKNKLVKRVLAGAKLNCNLIDLVITPESNRLLYLLQNLGLNATHGMVIPNTCYPPDKTENLLHPVYETIPKDSVKLLHVGSIGADGHYFEEMLTALPENWTLILVGIIPDHQKSIINKHKARKNIITINQVPHWELASLYRGANLGLILYKGIDFNFEYCAPNKLYEFWSFGLPVIAHSLKGLQSVFRHPFQGKLFDFTGASLQQDIEAWYRTAELPAYSRSLSDYFRENLQITFFADELKQQLINYCEQNQKNLPGNRHPARAY